MRFLADMGIAPRIVAWLRQQGHEAHHLLEQGLHRLPDLEISTRPPESNQLY
jgi:predicted nuclease of predicted toxin-antitoxin system